MRVFVPMPDEWDSGPAFSAEPLVPYRVGLPVWRQPRAEPEDEKDVAPKVPQAA